jgi:RNA polymerase sigma factor (sigma-70 family)
MTEPSGRPRGRPRKERPPRPSREEKFARAFLCDPDRFAVALIDAMLKLERGTARACVRVVAAVTKRQETTLRAKQRRCRSAAERQWREQAAAALASALQERFLEAAEIVLAEAAIAPAGGLTADGWRYIELRPPVTENDDEPASAPVPPAKSNPKLARRRELGHRFPCTLQHLRELVHQDARGGALVLRKEGTALPWKCPRNDRQFFGREDIKRKGALRWILALPLPKFNPPSPPAGDITECPTISRKEFPEEYKAKRLKGGVGADVISLRGPLSDQAIASMTSRIAQETQITLRLEPWPMCALSRESIATNAWPALIGSDRAKPEWHALFGAVVVRWIEAQIPLAVGSRDYDAWIAEVARAVARDGSGFAKVDRWILSVAKRIARLWGLPMPMRVGGVVRVHHVEITDLTQQGLLGLLGAKRTYDPRHGHVLHSYIVKFVTAKIWELLRLSSSDLTVPKNYAAYRDYVDSGTFPHRIHLDENPSEEGQDGKSDNCSFHEMVADPDAASPSARAEFLSAWESLDNREQEALRLLASHLSAEQIAARMKISERTVYRILEGARSKIVGD